LLLVFCLLLAASAVPFMIWWAFTDHCWASQQMAPGVVCSCLGLVMVLGVAGKNYSVSLPSILPVLDGEVVEVFRLLLELAGELLQAVGLVCRQLGELVVAEAGAGGGELG
jgi:hypothetical protein